MKFNSSLLLPLLLLTKGVYADGLVFTDTFDSHVVGSKASANQKDPNVAVRWDSEAYTEIVDWEEYKRSRADVKAVPPSKVVVSNKMLKFAYGSGADSWSEQRFILNQNLSDIWMQYDIYIPASYTLLDGNPGSANYMGGGHKVAVFYADGYSHPNTTMVFGEIFARKDPKGNSTPPGDTAPYYIDSTLSYYPNTADKNERFYSYMGTGDDRKESWVRAGERDRWQRRTFHFKFPSQVNKSDGLVEIWIQRFDQSGNPLSVSKEMSVVGNFYGKQNYFNAGYLNGYNNDGFKNPVAMLVDNFRLAKGNGCVKTESNCVIPANIDTNALAISSSPVVELRDVKGTSTNQ